MAYPPMLPEADELRRLRRRHRADTCPVRGCTGIRHTYVQIADAFGVTKGAVYQAYRRAGLTAEGSRVDHNDMIPWTLRDEHRHQQPAGMLRLVARIRQDDHRIPPKKLRMVQRWMRDRSSQAEVVDYDSEDGWRYVQAHPGDAPFVRVPDDDAGEAYDDPAEREIWQDYAVSGDVRRDRIAELRAQRSGLPDAQRFDQLIARARSLQTETDKGRGTERDIS